jgi:hypothetical protein
MTPTTWPPPAANLELNGGFWHLGTLPTSETICPDDPDDWSIEIGVGGPPFGNAVDVCTSNGMGIPQAGYLGQAQSAAVGPFSPLCRITVWAHTQFSPADAVTSLTFTVEGRATANPQNNASGTWRTDVMRQTNNTWLALDARNDPTPSTDETWTVVIPSNQNPGQYVDAADGEIRIRSGAFFPGNVLSPNWDVRVDLYEVVVDTE